MNRQKMERGCMCNAEQKDPRLTGVERRREMGQGRQQEEL